MQFIILATLSMTYYDNKISSSNEIAISIAWKKKEIIQTIKLCIVMERLLRHLQKQEWINKE